MEPQAPPGGHLDRGWPLRQYMVNTGRSSDADMPWDKLTHPAELLEGFLSWHRGVHNDVHGSLPRHWWAQTHREQLYQLALDRSGFYSPKNYTIHIEFFHFSHGGDLFTYCLFFELEFKYSLSKILALKTKSIA